VPARPPVTPSTLGEIARLFLRLATTAFGGPAAHIAMMEDEVVRRRGWLTRDEFLDYLGATNLIPGPNSTELAIHIGYSRGGWPGLIVAGASFIVPAALIVTAVAWAYVTYGALPQVSALLYGVKPVVIAIMMRALWSLARSAIKDIPLLVLACAALTAVVFGVNELAVLAASGLFAVTLRNALYRRAPGWRVAAVPPLVKPGAVIFAGTATAAVSAGLGTLFLVFVKIGSVLFGSGYVLLAFLRADFVQRLGWLTEQQLLDATAVGQITPGPVFTTATFIGYVLRGPAGAAVATLGIFLPAFVFVALSGPLVPRLRRSPTAGAVLDGVNVGSLALMGFVTWQLGRAAMPDVLAAGIAAVSLLALIRTRVNPAWLIAAGGVAGLIVMMTRSAP
jgi:chromate transporter